MATVVYNSFWKNVLNGTIDLDTNTIKASLHTNTYVPDKGLHEFRSSVTNEVAASGTYAAGGSTVTVTITQNNVGNTVTVAFSDHSYTSATITARYVLLYKSTGVATTDALIAAIDFGADVTVTNGTFNVDFTTPLTINNA